MEHRSGLEACLLAELFAKFDKGHTVWTVLPHHCWVPAISAQRVTGANLSLCNCLLPPDLTPVCLPMETASKPPRCPAQPSITLQTGSCFLIPFCGRFMPSGFTRNEPTAYPFWAPHRCIFSRRILVKVFSQLLSKSKGNGLSSKNLWFFLDCMSPCNSTQCTTLSLELRAPPPAHAREEEIGRMTQKLL